MSAKNSPIEVYPPKRIAAYDRARAIAIIGMILVNADKIIGSGHSEIWWMKVFIDFLTGRAAVIFVMLAGLGMVQSYARTATDDRPALRKRMMLRAVLLGFIGCLLMNVWHADILHYYTAFTLCGVSLLGKQPLRITGILLIMVFFSLPVCALVAYEFEGGQIIESFIPSSPLSLLFDYLFLGDLYPVFPWVCFFVLGMLLGHLEKALNTQRCWLIFAGSCFVLITIEILSALLNTETIVGRWVDIENPLWRAFTVSEAFPVCPLFVFSGGATGLALIALLRLGIQSVQESRYIGPLVAFGRMSLTMYISHILIGQACNQWIIKYYGITVGNQAFLFAIGFIIAGVMFAMVWIRYFRQGPLELVMHAMTHFFASSTKPAKQLSPSSLRNF